MSACHGCDADPRNREECATNCEDAARRTAREMAAPAPRPLTLPEQRALETLAQVRRDVVEGPWAGLAWLAHQGHRLPTLLSLVTRGLAIADSTSQSLTITDRGRTYLDLLVKPTPGATP